MPLSRILFVCLPSNVQACHLRNIRARLKVFRRVKYIFSFCVFAFLAFTLNACHQSSPLKNKVAETDDNRRSEEAAVGESLEVQVYEDEAMLRGTMAVIGGTIKNVTDKKLDALFVELELKRRDQEAMETKRVTVVPSSLPPGGQGRYQISLPTRDWSGARVTRVRSDSRDSDIRFASSPGARRPPERPPQIKINASPPPRSKPKGEEFINTPDNPSKIP